MTFGFFRARILTHFRAAALGFEPKLPGSLAIVSNYEAFQVIAQKAAPLPIPLYNLALARAGLSRDPAKLYCDRPNILSYHTYVRLDPEDKVLYCQGFDIVANELAIRPGSGVDSFSTRVVQGILDTNAEAVLLSGCGKVDSTASILADASRQGIEWLTVRDTKSPAWQKANLPKDLRARIAKDLAAGYVVVIPSKLLHMENRPMGAWWRVDPITGTALGMGDRGWGQTLDETLIIGGLVLPATVLCFAAWRVAHGGPADSAEQVLR